MNYNLENPAARLLRIFNRMEGADRNAATFDILTYALEVNGDTTNAHTCIGDFLKIPSQIEEKMVEQASERILVAVKQIAITISDIVGNAYRGNTWGHVSVDVNTYLHLELMAQNIDGNSALRENLSESQLNSIRKSLNDLIEQLIDASDIPPEMREYLSHQIKKAKDLLDNYHITGIQPTIEVMEAIFGHTMINPAFRDEAFNGETKVNSIMRKIAEVAAVVSASTGIISITDSSTMKALLDHIN